MLFVARPSSREMYVPLSLPFARILLIFPVSFFFLTHSYNGTVLAGSPVTQISPLAGGLQTWRRSQFVLFLLEDFSCLPLSSSRSFLQPPAIFFDWVSKARAVPQSSVDRLVNLCVQLAADHSAPFSGTVLQLLFCFALKK